MRKFYDKLLQVLLCNTTRDLRMAAAVPEGMGETGKHAHVQKAETLRIAGDFRHFKEKCSGFPGRSCI